MALPQRLALTTGKRSWNTSLGKWGLLAGLIVGLGIALLFGHAYDIKIFMATGYLVASGQNPYVAQDLTAVFQDSAFRGMTSIGYPPPWALILGLIYQVTYAWIPNLLLYNLAIKLPIIAALIGLAYLVAGILEVLGAEAGEVRKAWITMLVSPFVVYFSAAWGQFDAIVALLALFSMLLLYRGRTFGAAASLALAVAFKPTAMPLILVAFLYLWGRSRKKALRYGIAVLLGLLLFCVAPFVVFGWNATPILRGWNAHFTVAGGMSWMTYLELLKDSYLLPGSTWLLGLAWLPAIGVASLYTFKRGIGDFRDLLKVSTGFILVFFLTRTWLSEPNVLLLLPFVVILSYSGDLPKAALAALWSLPLIFTIFNNSLPQLLFPAFPRTMEAWLGLDEIFRSIRLIARIGVVFLWQAVGWYLVVMCLGNRPSEK